MADLVEGDNTLEIASLSVPITGAPPCSRQRRPCFDLSVKSVGLAPLRRQPAC